MEATLAYIAGVVDGEGTLFVGRYPRRGNAQLAYRGYFAVANTHVPMLRHVKAVIGGKIVEQGKGRGTYSLTLTANEIRKWLPQLLPHLVVKRDQAEVLLAFLERQAGNASAAVSPELLAFYESCYLRLKRLKARRYTFKERRASLGQRACAQCAKPFEAFSNQPQKAYCSNYCKRRIHWTRSNARIRDGVPAWSTRN